MKQKVVLNTMVLLILSGSIAYAQASPDMNQYVSRQEYDNLKQEIDALKSEIAAMKKGQAGQSAQATRAPEVAALKAEVEEMKRQRDVQSEDVNQTIDELNAQIKDVKDKADIYRPGTTKKILTGYASAGFTDRRGENSTFSAAFNPVFLWELDDRLLFEGELEFTLDSPKGTGSSETITSLEYADVSYLLNDYMTVGTGKFLLPFGIFNERLHPAWINKLPDRPLPYDDAVGIAPETGIGAFLRGAVPVDSMKFNYALYVDNGPALITDDPKNAGMLDFDNFTDNNHNKAVGGRIGFLPIAELEIGYSIQEAKVSPSGFEKVDMLLQAVDMSYKRQIDYLRGTVDVHAEYVWSHVGEATFGPSAAPPFGPLRFDNGRNAYYIQAAYRPTQVDDKILKNLEFVLRYDALEVPSGAPGSVDEHRWTPGIDYWVNPNMVLKLAYQFDERSGEEDRNALLFQTALGF
jgi:hypothetical protein